MVSPSAERLRTYFEHAPDAVFVEDLAGRVIDVNPAACRLHEIPRDELIGMDVLDLVPPEDRGMVSQDFAGWQTGELRTHQGVSYTRSGGRVPVEIRANMITYDGAPAILMIVREISERLAADDERRRLEAQVEHGQRLESLGVLAGGIAHDFNNLLVGILGSAELARLDVAPGSNAAENIDQVEACAKRAAELCQQMLAYAGEGRVEVTRLSLNDIIEDLHPLVSRSLNKKTTLKFELADRLPAIDGEASQIRQVALNLVINASEALEEGLGVVRIATGVAHCRAEDMIDHWFSHAVGDYVFFEVRDTGSGMTDEVRERIFDPFYSTKFAGRGLGLAAVIGIVRGHNGAIEVKSRSGEGTTFRVYFPVAGPPDSVRRRDAENTQAEWQGQGHVLLVDDEEAVRGVASRMLSNIGFEVLTACDGRSALELYAQHADEVACVLLDLNMPVMGGEEVLATLRDVEGADVPIVISSGYSENESYARIARSEVQGFIQKPYRLAGLREVMRQAIECRRGAS